MEQKTTIYEILISKSIRVSKPLRAMPVSGPATQRSGPGSQRDWIRCVVADVRPTGWLRYELADGSKGLAMPGGWRAR